MFSEENRTEKFDLISALAFFAWLFLGASLFAVPLMIIAPLILNMSPEEYASNVQLVTEHSYIVGVIAHILGIVAFVLLYKKIIKQDAVNFKSNWIKYIIIIVVGFVLLYLSNYLMGYLYELLGLGGKTSQNQQGIIDALHGSTVPFVIIYTVILAPIFEEIVFRKCLFGLFKKNTMKTVILSAIIFAGIHTIPTCIEMIPSLFTGDAKFTDLYLEFIYIFQYIGQAFALAFVYHKTKGNIIPCIMIHFLNNFISILGTLLFY